MREFARGELCKIAELHHNREGNCERRIYRYYSAAENDYGVA
jgi:hypothetical protein